MKLKFTLLSFSILLGICSARAQGNLWGMTSAGVADNKGVIFKTNANGTGYAVQYDFVTDFPGTSPQNALTELNGKLYGMTFGGGANDEGLIFEYDPSNGNYVSKFDFSSAASGASPTGGFVVGINGHLYGMTSGGGANGDGVLFEYDPVGNSFTKKFDFSSAINGSSPQGSLILASNGKMYGMTSQGGANGAGVLFEYDPSTTSPVNRFDFSSTNGSIPYGDLVQFTTNSKLYGMTSSGGTAGKGVLFEFDITTGYNKKVNFSGPANGATPYGSLIQALDGKLYGMTLLGGSNSQGVLFSYDPTGSTYTKKLDLTASAGAPQGSLFQNSDGLFYGMTLNGGSNGDGTLFQYDATGNILTIKYNFLNSLSGANPQSNLIKASNGKFYGMTPYGNPTNNGVLFEYDPTSDTFTKKLDFSNASNGSNPQGGLVQAVNGLLYGMTANGGVNSQGVLFELDPSISAYTKKVDFSYATNGAFPTGSLVLAPDNKLYGMTPYGGANGDGVLFQYDPGSTAVVPKINFLAASSGANPQRSLVAAPNGKLYGMTSQGGAGGHGVLFEFDPTSSSFTIKYSFTTTTGGMNPNGSLNQAANGKLYGMTNQGGVNGFGVIFEYDPTSNTYTKKIDFTNTNGAHPYGDLLQSSNGKMYGLTSGGGTNSVGVLFEYDPILVTVNVKLNFDTPTTGSSPVGTLIEVAPGKLFGMNSSGGTQLGGVLFQYDLSGSSFTNLLNFGGANGSAPQYGSLLLVPAKQTQSITFSSLPTKMFSDPPFALTATASSSLPVTYTSSDPTIASISGSTVTILGFGTVTITASQGGDANYNFALNVAQPLVINRASQTITFGPLAPVTFSPGGSFGLTATASSSLAVSYVSSDPSIASITSSTVNILKAGTVTITASQAGNSLYDPAPDVPQNLTINKANQTIAFPPPAARTYGDVPFFLAATASSGLAVDFNLTPPNPVLVSITGATVTGSTVTILQAGNTTITASQPGNGNYNAATIDQKVLTINKANQTITFNSLTPVTFGVAPFTLPGTASSGLPLSYSSSDVTVATVSGSTITILKAGSTDITATQAGNVNYNAAPGVPPQTLVVNKASQTITFSALPVKSNTDPSFTLSATASSGLAVSYISGNTAVVTISGNTVTIVGVGTSTITASQSGNGNYNAAPSVNQDQVVNTKSSQTITFGALASKLFGAAPFSLTATASSGLVVSYVSGNTAVATISGSTVTIVGVGTSTITASQSGNGSFNPAPSVNQDFVVQKGNQTITFPTPTSPALSDPTFTVNATASSGLAVSFVAVTTDKFTISGSTGTPLKAGSAVIEAQQNGNANYNAATAVDQVFCIRPAKPTITVSSGTTNSPILTSSSPTGNVWFLDGVQITGANNTTYTVAKSGSYTVAVVAETCLSDQSDPKAIVITGDLPDISVKAAVYPNPAKDKLFVDLSEFSASPVELKIIDLTGRSIHRQSATGGVTVEINVADHPVGMYVLFLSQGSKAVELKYIKN